jgi:hypothetical protein
VHRVYRKCPVPCDRHIRYFADFKQVSRYNDLFGKAVGSAQEPDEYYKRSFEAHGFDSNTILSLVMETPGAVKSRSQFNIKLFSIAVDIQKYRSTLRDY